MSPTGPRFNAGYQFPRTDAASLRRERPLLCERGLGAFNATVELVPLTGGRTRAWDLCARWDEPRPGAPPTSVAWSFLCHDDEATARAAFAEIVTGFRSGVFPALLPE